MNNELNKSERVNVEKNIEIEDPYDVKSLIEDVTRSAKKLDFRIETLGTVGEFPILVLFPKASDPQKPNLLIAGGFHGEEPAGSWAINEFLGSYEELISSDANLSFLPVVNPSGMSMGQRRNIFNENPNSGFPFDGNEVDSPSREGQMLLEHIDTLLLCARDGFLTLHEDSGMKRFYACTNEPGKSPGMFSKALLEVGSRTFGTQENGKLYDDEPYEVKDGLVFNFQDNTFEGFLTRSGIPFAACTETPGSGNINLRVRTNVDLIRAFVSVASQLHKNK